MRNCPFTIKRIQNSNIYQWTVTCMSLYGRFYGRTLYIRSQVSSWEASAFGSKNEYSSNAQQRELFTLGSQTASYFVKLNFERTAAAWSPPNRKYGCLSAAAADSLPLLRRPLSHISFVAKSHPLPESSSRMVKSGLSLVDFLHLLRSYSADFISVLKFFKPAEDRRVGIAIWSRTIPAEYMSKRSGLFSWTNWTVR